MKKTAAISLCFLLIIIAIAVWLRMPILGDEWSKQTLYVGLLDAWHGASEDDKAHALWIDDDSTEGVFQVKGIADKVGITPCFGVIADRMTPAVADSLASWQKKGEAGVVLHGLHHERWKTWNPAQIRADITQSLQRLDEQGFDTAKILKMVIPPHGCNTPAIRSVIQEQGYQMISGASLVNPDRRVFQLGRIAITPQTDIEQMQRLLQNALHRRAFVIFSTHSSIPDWFSAEKTYKVLQTAKEMGFEFDISK